MKNKVSNKTNCPAGDIAARSALPSIAAESCDRISPSAERRPVGQCSGSDRRARANATIEIVMVLPLLLFLVFGMAEFAQFFYVKAAFQSAARDAARSASTTLATQGSPAASATKTLAFANIAFNASFMTIFDDATNTVVTDVSTIPSGDAFTVTIQQYYDQLPGVYRPLYQMTGQGIRNGKLVVGKCTMIKE